MAEPSTNTRLPDDKAGRRAARALIAEYHREQLASLLEHVRDGFRHLDRSEIDVFDLDDLIHRYKRATTELWKFCGSSGGQWLRAANMLSYLREQGEEPDWWARSAQDRDSRS